MMSGGKKFEFGYEGIVLWKIDARGGANLVNAIEGESWLLRSILSATIKLFLCRGWG